MTANESTPNRKARGAFFTPPAIAEFLARWAIANDPGARVLDPTCGEAVFLLAAGARLRELGAAPTAVPEQLTGVDLHQPSLDESGRILRADGLGARLVRSDFFELVTPAQIGDALGWQDAVIGNPPFVRYQQHRGDVRKRSASAALAQGVRLSGLASSWAATLVHGSAFLKPTGRLAMVLPAELLTVHYAEPLRRWLRRVSRGYRRKLHNPLLPPMRRRSTILPRSKRQWRRMPHSSRMRAASASKDSAR